MLQDKVEKARVLDLFSGVGTVGIEALSRGADKAVFVENNPRILRILRRNLESLCHSSRWDVIRVDAKKACDLKTLSSARFDLIFCDPPYPMLDLSIVSNYLGMLEDHGVMVVQHPKKIAPADARHTRVVGSNALSFWRKE